MHEFDTSGVEVFFLFWKCPDLKAIDSTKLLTSSLLRETRRVRTRGFYVTKVKKKTNTNKPSSSLFHHLHNINFFTLLLFFILNPYPSFCKKETGFLSENHSVEITFMLTIQTCHDE